MSTICVNSRQKLFSVAYAFLRSDYGKSKQMVVWLIAGQI